MTAEMPPPVFDRPVEFRTHPRVDFWARAFSSRSDEDERIHECIVDGPLQEMAFSQLINGHRADFPGISIAMQRHTPAAIAAHFRKNPFDFRLPAGTRSGSPSKIFNLQF